MANSISVVVRLSRHRAAGRRTRNCRRLDIACSPVLHGAHHFDHIHQTLPYFVRDTPGPIIETTATF
jgi:hypothetical protein